VTASPRPEPGCTHLRMDEAHFEVPTSGDSTTLKCMWCAIAHRELLWRSARVAVVVGSLLILLNQGDKLLLALGGDVATDLWWKVPLTYCVPFCVATYGALGNAKRPAQE